VGAHTPDPQAQEPLSLYIYIWTEVWPTRPTPPSFINQAARDGAYFDRERRAGARDQILYNKDLHAESINERD
jgi:hypothetical protein